MGLGKTVEVLALILTHTRQDVRQDALTLPEVGGSTTGLGKAEHMFSRKHRMLNIWFSLKSTLLVYSVAYDLY